MGQEKLAVSMDDALDKLLETANPEKKPAPGRFEPEIGERRLLTILVLSIPSAPDPEAGADQQVALRLMEKLFRIFTQQVHRNSGWVEQAIGRSLMAVFGTEDAPEVNAWSAANTAMEMLSAVERLQRIAYPTAWAPAIKIGIDSGEMTRGRYFGYDAISGDPINIAALLSENAPQDSILISKEIKRYISDRFSFIEHPPIRMNQARHLQAYSLSGRKLSHIRCPWLSAPGSSAFVGRKATLKKLEDLFESDLFDTSNSRQVSNNSIGLTGVEGIGKTALIGELCRTFTFPIHVITSCPDRQFSPPYNAIVALLQDWLGDIQPGSTTTGQLKEKMEELQKNAEYPEDLTHIVPVLAILLESHISDPYLDKLKPRLLQREIFLAFKKLVQEMARYCWEDKESLLILVFEDFHFADALSRKILDYFFRNNKSPYPLYAIFTQHPGTISLKFSTMDNCRNTQIKIEPLSEMEELSFLRGMTEGVLKLPETVRKKIRVHTAGNALHSEMLLRYILDTKRFAEEDGEAKLKLYSVPDNSVLLKTLIMYRINLLSGSLREILNVASVMGKRIVPDALSHILQDSLDESAVRKSLDNLYRFGFLRVVSNSGRGDAFEFTHYLIRTVTYDMLLPAEKIRIHRLCAEFFESRAGDEPINLFRLSRDWISACDPEKSYKYLVDSADYAFKINAPDVALNQVTQALDLFSDTDERKYRLLHIRGDIYLRLGDYSKALADFKYGLALNFKFDQKEANKALSFFKVGLALAETGKADESVQCFRQAGKLFRRTGDHVLEARAIRNAGFVLSAEEKYESAYSFFDQAREVSELNADHHGQCIALLYSGTSRFMQNQFEKAAADLKRSLSFAQKTGNPNLEIGLLGILASNFLAEGRFSSAQRNYARALEKSREINDKYLECVSCISLGRSLFYQNKLTRALDCYQSILDKVENYGFQDLESELMLEIGHVCYFLNHFTEARHSLNHAIKLLDRAHRKLPAFYARAMLARVLMESEDPITSDTLARQALNSLEQSDFDNVSFDSPVIQILFTAYLNLTEQHDPGAGDILRKTCTLLMNSLEIISVFECRKNILETPFNSPVIEAWETNFGNTE